MTPYVPSPTLSRLSYRCWTEAHAPTPNAGSERGPDIVTAVQCAALRRRACLCCCAAAVCRAFASCQMQVIVLRKVRTAVVQVFLRVPLIWVQGDVFRRSAVSRRSSRPLKIVHKTGASGRKILASHSFLAASRRRRARGCPRGKVRLCYVDFEACASGHPI